MATESIAQFPSLPAGQVASDDFLPIVDVSDLSSPTGTTKKTLISSIQQSQNVANSLFNVRSPIFGAVGNGVTDDYPAFLATVTAASAAGGGIVFVPLGTYLLSSQLVLPPFVSLVGTGRGSIIDCGVGTGFGIKAGNSASILSYGITISNLAIFVQNTAASAFWLYGVVDCTLQNLYIEGQVGTTTTIGVQIDGANISAFFILMQNVTCNHVFKGFVHTTTGTTKPTQVTGIGCTALCDNTAGSIGLEIKNVAGVGMGDGVTYLGGNMEACIKGVSLNGSGTSIIGMRFENSTAFATDIQFETLARCNQIIGGANVYSIVNISGSRTNQVFGVPKDQSSVVSQVNQLDETQVLGAFTLGASRAGGVGFYLNGTTSGTNPNQFGAAMNPVFNSTASTAGHGISIHPETAAAAFTLPLLYGLKVQPPNVGAGSSITTQYGIFVDDLVEATTNYAIYTGVGKVRLGGQFACNGATPQSSAAGGAALAAYGAGANGFDTAGHAQEIHDKLNLVLTTLRANGIMTT